MIFAQPAAQPKNLFIVCDDRQSWKDFFEIGQQVRILASDISVHVVQAGVESAVVPPYVWSRPTLIVQFAEGTFVPRRGRTFSNREMTKTEQYKRFMAAGIATPLTAIFKFGTRYDPAEWGEFVVLKPANLRLTSDKDNVRLLRTTYLNGLGREEFARLGFAPATTLLIQAFVDTGPQPQHYRVLTLFGEPLYAQHKVMHRRRADLDATDEEIAKTVVADGVGDNTRSYGDYPGIVAFAREVAEKAFPEIPLLGIDVVEEEGTGALSVLEVNAGGNTWHFSSPASAYWREKHPEHLEAMKRQFDAFKAAARALVRLTRTYAC
jgi:hypothetical protein